MPGCLTPIKGKALEMAGLGVVVQAMRELRVMGQLVWEAFRLAVGMLIQMGLKLTRKQPEVEVAPEAVAKMQVRMSPVTAEWESVALLVAARLGLAEVVEAVSESPLEQGVPVVLELVVLVVSQVLE
jgi:hypothetical protein